MTYRERREARAERLRGWAEKREQKAATAFEQSHRIADQIPFGQPILVGHHSERHARRDQERIWNSVGRGVEHSKKAERMTERASNIESQLDRSIYSDDEDAIENLRDRIAGLEAERDRIKAYNASCRKGSPDDSALDHKQQAQIKSIRNVGAYQLGKNGAAPAYWLSNLNGNLNRNKKRLEQLERAR